MNELNRLNYHGRFMLITLDCSANYHSSNKTASRRRLNADARYVYLYFAILNDKPHFSCVHRAIVHRSIITGFTLATCKLLFNPHWPASLIKFASYSSDSLKRSAVRTDNLIKYYWNVIIGIAHLDRMFDVLSEATEQFTRMLIDCYHV